MLPNIEQIGLVQRRCRRQSLTKMQSISRSFLEALHTCFNNDSGDDLLQLYARDALVFGTSAVFIGRDEFAESFVACRTLPPNGVKGLQILRILESIAGNSVYYLFTVNAPGFQDYNFSSSITSCRSKIVRTVSTLDTTELVPISV